MTRYVVAVSLREAYDLAPSIGHEFRSQATAHLERVRAHPTDTFYAKQYRVWKVNLKSKEKSHDR